MSIFSGNFQIHGVGAAVVDPLMLRADDNRGDEWSLATAKHLQRLHRPMTVAIVVKNDIVSI